MKKINLMISLLFVMLVIPFHVSASGLDLNNYPTETLEKALASEQIDITGDELDKYNEKDSSDKIKIYVFRKNGCGNCKNFLNYVKTVLIPNYGGKFEIVSFELGEQRNFTPLNTIAEFFNNRPTNDLYTTPYIAVGNKTFTGFIDDAKQKQIEEIISSNTTFDVVEKINSGFLNINDTVKKEFVDSDNKGIKLSSDKALDVSYILKVTEGTHKDLVLDGYKFISSYDITMYNNKDRVVSLDNGVFTISIPVANEYDSYKVAYINNNQITEVLDATYENGYVVFTTTHLSEYTVYGSKKDVIKVTTSNVEEKNPNTLDSIIVYQIMFVVGCIFLSLSFNLYRKQKD